MRRHRHFAFVQKAAVELIVHQIISHNAGYGTIPGNSFIHSFIHLFNAPSASAPWKQKNLTNLTQRETHDCERNKHAVKPCFSRHNSLHVCP